MIVKRLSFKKEERLCHKKKIDALFDKSNKENESFAVFPLRVVAAVASDENISQVLFSVPKRKFKKAVDRNQIKRRMREAYRINKSDQAERKTYYLAFLYTASEKLPFDVIEASMKKIVQRLGGISGR
jgi:ribonuclease P protein component